jgi:hypothetical protein
MKKRYRALAVLLVLALVAGACGSADSTSESAQIDSESGTTQTTSAPARAEDAATKEQVAEATANALGNGGVDAVVVPVDIGRDIIYVANLNVSVNDVAVASREATRIIQGLGGFVFGQQTSGGNDAVSVLTFKVLPEDFQTALDRLGDIGEVRSQQITSDDVTERVVNIESRIITAEASVTRLQGFLANATDINTIANLERELLERETQLETLRGQLRTLQDQVALATITVTISQKHSAPSMVVYVSSYEGHNEGLACPGSDIFRIEKDSELTVCFEVINTGDTALEAVTLIDSGLKIDLDDLTVVSGDPTSVLQPGDGFVLAHEVLATENIRFITNVTGVPVDENGEPVGGRTVGDSHSSTITTFEPEGIPTFMDGLEASWGVFVAAILYVVLFIGAALPFLVPAILGWWLWQKRPRRSIDEPSDLSSDQQTDRPTDEEPKELIDA